LAEIGKVFLSETRFFSSNREKRLARSAVGVGLGLMYLAMAAVSAFGPHGGHVAEDEAFPCQQHRCACATARKCLSSCCCYPKTSEEAAAAVEPSADEATLASWSCSTGDADGSGPLRLPAVAFLDRPELPLLADGDRYPPPHSAGLTQAEPAPLQKIPIAS